MLSLASTLRIFLAVEPADMRKGFDGLSQLVRDRIAQDPLSGHLYVFRNRRRDRIKILYWDRDGLALWYKRLEAGSFEPLRGADAAETLELDATELALLLSGVSLATAQRRKRFAATA